MGKEAVVMRFMRTDNKINIAPTAVVSDDVKIGEGTLIWNFAQVREGAVIGKNCNIANGVYIDKNVRIGNNVIIQNKASIYRNAIIEDNVFIGPHVCLINDKNPRAGVISELSSFWIIGKGATIGAGSIIMPNVNIGKCALVGAGSLVTKDVPDHGLVYGSPAILKGFVCECGQVLSETGKQDNIVAMVCKKCEKKFSFDKKTYDGIK